MIFVMQSDATDDQIEHLMNRIRELGLTPHISRGVERTIVGAIGDETILRDHSFESIPGVDQVMPILKPFKLSSREFRNENTLIKINKITIGGKQVIIGAGPCSVESPEQTIQTAMDVKASGATLFRGGAFKPRTSPYTFQGLGEEGLKYLAEARDVTGLPVITEVMDTRDVELVGRYADIFQIGARNMQNYNLLKEVGMAQKPVLLKRAWSATMEEVLMSAEYIMAKGNYNIILCERGIRTFEKWTRNTLDLSAVPVLKHYSHLPIFVDPSHGVGFWRWIEPMSLAAVACGADGLLIEVHPNPEQALSDGAQSLLPDKFKELMIKLKAVAMAVGRTI